MLSLPPFLPVSNPPLHHQPNTQGSSGACETFASPHSLLSPTALSSSFQVLDLELWALEADFMLPTTAVEVSVASGVSAAEKARGAEDIEAVDRGRGW